MLQSTFLLFAFNLFFTRLFLLLNFLADLSAFTFLSLILFLSLVAFQDHLFGLADPFNILDKGLLDFIITHLAIKDLFGFIVLISQLSYFVLDLVHLSVDVSNIVFDVLFGIFKFTLLLLHFANFSFKLSDDLVGWCQTVINLLLLLFPLDDSCFESVDLGKDWL